MKKLIFTFGLSMLLLSAVGAQANKCDVVYGKSPTKYEIFQEATALAKKATDYDYTKPLPAEMKAQLDSYLSQLSSTNLFESYKKIYLGVFILRAEYARIYANSRIASAAATAPSPSVREADARHRALVNEADARHRSLVNDADARWNAVLRASDARWRAFLNQ